MIGKCNCNPVFIFIYVIVGALTLWLLSSAFILQFNDAGAVQVFPWWFAAVLVGYIAKMCKWKSCENCGAHGNHCHECMPEEKKM